MEQSKNAGIGFKLAIVWLAIILLGSFWLTVREMSDPVSMVVIPQAPKEGEPVITTFKLNNPSSHDAVIKYQFYTNGELLKEGTSYAVSGSGKTYKYAYSNPLPLGQQLNFVVKTWSEQGNHEKIMSSPPYPPQVWSSFVSFASFSTSVMSFMSSMTYYQSTFGGNAELNVGFIVAMVFLCLMIFMELTTPALQAGMTSVLGRLRIEFSTVTWILLIVFMGIFYTKIVMILTS
jgi:hypothetical protein